MRIKDLKLSKKENIGNCKNTSQKIWEKFLDLFLSAEKVEEKIQISIEFMKQILDDKDALSLKYFWEAKKLSSPLFKEKMNYWQRKNCLKEYDSLTNKARMLQKIADEQVCFSVEQIKIAVSSLKDDINNYDKLIEKMSELKSYPILKDVLTDEKEYYDSYKEFSLLKLLISRYESLRKEVLSIDMRTRNKNSILKQLSEIGDFLFPKRKSITEKTSELLVTDIKNFIKPTTSSKQGHLKYKESFKKIIKLQKFIKNLAVNKQSFNYAYKNLGIFWDELREEQGIENKNIEKTSKEQEKNFQNLSCKIEEFVDYCKNDTTIDKERVTENSQSIETDIDKSTLSRPQNKQLKHKLQKAYYSIIDGIKQKNILIEEEKINDIKNLQSELTSLIENEKTYTFEDLYELSHNLHKKFFSTSTKNLNGLIFERNFTRLKSILLDKKFYKNISRTELKALLIEKQDLIVKIKDEIEFYRKEINTSHLDFEAAITYSELLDSTKNQLDDDITTFSSWKEMLNLISQKD